MKPKAFIQDRPIVAYFVMTFTISWLGAYSVAAPDLIRGAAIPRMVGLLMFPLLLIGPSITGVILTKIGDGRMALRDLVSRMSRWRVEARWYATALLVPPCLILLVLVTLSVLVSSTFAPNTFPPGILFGLVAGFIEEIGWMGYAFPKLCLKYSPLTASILLGVLWGSWHAPAIDFLSAAFPHGAYRLAFFIAFVIAMTAIRVLIAWVYTNTKSVLLAQLMHASSTGCLVIFSPSHVSPAQEAFWYGIYAAALWIVVAMVVRTYGKRLT